MSTAAEAIAERAPGLEPRLGLMLGSGLGELAQRLGDRVEIPYGELPGFHVGGLAGHAGPGIPLAGAAMECGRFFPVSYVLVIAQEIGKHMVIPVPPALLIKGNQEQIALEQALQHCVAV